MLTQISVTHGIHILIQVSVTDLLLIGLWRTFLTTKQCAYHFYVYNSTAMLSCTAAMHMQWFKLLFCSASTYTNIWIVQEHCVPWNVTKTVCCIKLPLGQSDNLMCPLCNWQGSADKEYVVTGLSDGALKKYVHLHCVSLCSIQSIVWPYKACNVWPLSHTCIPCVYPTLCMNCTAHFHVLGELHLPCFVELTIAAGGWKHQPRVLL